MSIEYKDIAKIIFNRIPGSEERYREYASTWGDSLSEVLVYVLVENIIGEMTREVCDASDQETRDRFRAVLRCFSDLIEFGDEDTRDLVEIGFRPHLEFVVNSYPECKQYLPQSLATLLSMNLDYRVSADDIRKKRH